MPLKRGLFACDIKLALQLIWYILQRQDLHESPSHVHDSYGG